MEQYIKKFAVVAEIEKRLKVHMESNHGFSARYDELKDILSFLDTLEVKEVDLEKEVINWWNAHYSSKAYTFEGYTGHYVENSTLIEIAKHFYELGMAARNKAQKGK